MTRLLVLRPHPGAGATAARIRAAGHEAVVAPLFRMRPVDWKPPVEPVDALMLTSAAAVRLGGPALGGWHHLPVHAVGGATAAAARAAGFRDVREGPGDAAALVAMLGGAGRVLHLAGREHKPDLPPGGLRRIVYAANAVEALPDAAREALAEGAVALLHSPRAATIFAALVGTERGDIAIATLSSAVAEAAGNGWAGVAIAPRSNDAALVSLATRHAP